MYALLTMSERIANDCALETRLATSGSQSVLEGARAIAQGAALAQAFFNACELAEDSSVEQDIAVREFERFYPRLPDIHGLAGCKKLVQH